MYPLLSEYIEAIKAAEDNFEELKHLRPVLNEDGEPVFSSGGFAVVFKMKDEQTGRLHAVKCFLKEQEGRTEAYRQIAEELEFVSSTFLTPIKYLDKELFVDAKASDETEFPVLLMDWVEGQTLDKYIREHIDDKYELSLLAYQFSRLAMWLIPQPFAHGDLKPDNIIVKEDGTLVLVDYDGMFVPAMKGQRARELGSPDFRHPGRTEEVFDEHIDDFSLVSILLSLKAISLQPNLLEKYGAADRLLFSAKDYRNLSESQVMDATKTMMQDSELATLYSLFILSSAQNNLSQASFRLLNLSRPQIQESENLSTEVTEDDLANAWVDEYGVKYSKDRKRLLKAPRLFNGTIRNGTIVICDYAFSEYNSLQKIIIPNTVKAIGEAAFYWRFDLRWINIPSSVQKISDNPFAGCINLEIIICESKHFKFFNNILCTKDMKLLISCTCKEASFIIPSSIEKIGNNAFHNFKHLKNLIIPSSVTRIGRGAFYNCQSICEIDIPNSVVEIDDGAFESCESLKQISLPNSLGEIKNEVFSGCNSLKSIKITSPITRIGNKAFNMCSSLLQLEIPNSVESIGDSAFSWCTSLKEINLEDSLVKELKFHTFSWCEGLESVYLPNRIEIIGHHAFAYCGSLSSVDIPLSTQKIEFEAFKDCANLSTIRIHNTNIIIDELVLWGCKSLSSIYIPANSFEKYEKKWPKCKEFLNEHIEIGDYNGWRRVFRNNELEKVKEAKVVQGTFTKMACFYMNDGCQIYMPLIKESKLQIGDIIDLRKSKLIELCGEGINYGFDGYGDYVSNLIVEA